MCNLKNGFVINGRQPCLHFMESGANTKKVVFFFVFVFVKRVCLKTCSGF